MMGPKLRIHHREQVLEREQFSLIIMSAKGFINEVPFFQATTYRNRFSTPERRIQSGIFLSSGALSVSDMLEQMSFIGGFFILTDLVSTVVAVMLKTDIRKMHAA